ncbi:MAG: hypothetical protein GY803_09935 [Chloroflexi bacterium]|nr:hypothetical protein [Chloroflexota bacterium]
MTALELTADEWQRAQDLAQALAKDVDRNEFGKIVAYLQRTGDVGKVETLLRRLPNTNFIRSRRTEGYLLRIEKTWKRYLRGLDNERALLVASWAFRLMTYYQDQRPGRRARK